MSFLKATWWRPATALAVLALAVLALSLSGSGTAQAGDPGAVTIDPADKDIAAGGQGDVTIKIDPPASGTSIWIVQVKYDPAVVEVALDAQQNPICTGMASPAQGIAFATDCDTKDTDNDQKDDTAVAFGGWVQNDGGVAKGFTTQQTAATFTFKAVAAAPAHSNLTIAEVCTDPPPNPVVPCTTVLGPNGVSATPALSDGGIDIIESTGTPRIWGDGDCTGEIAPRDGQGILKNVLVQTPLSQTEPCPDIGSTVTVDGTPRIWGDGDCTGEIAPRDGQGILKNVLVQTALSQTEPCPDIGSTVQVNG